MVLKAGKVIGSEGPREGHGVGLKAVYVAFERGLECPRAGSDLQIDAGATPSSWPS